MTSLSAIPHAPQAHTRHPAAAPRGAGAAAPLVFDARRAAAWLAAMAAAVVLLGILREIYVAQFGLEGPLKNLRHFNMDSEGTLPAWFSSIVLIAAAALLAAIAGLSRNDRDADWRRWAFLSAIFLYLSVDEATAIHEVFIKPLRSAFDLGGVFYFSWVLPALAVLPIVGLYFLPFLLRLPRRHALRFMGCAALFVGGALGMEMVSGYFASRDGTSAHTYIAAAITEETMELAGSTLFVLCLAVYLHERWSTWTIEAR